VEARRDRLGLVQRGDGEIHRFRLVIDLHQEGGAARAAERRCPKLEDFTFRTSSALWVQARCPSGTLANAIAGEPLTSWQVRQWHQPQSNGSEASS
jgi:hypothetical protein